MKRILGILLMVLLLISPFSSVYALETPAEPSQTNNITVTEENKDNTEEVNANEEKIEVKEEQKVEESKAEESKAEEVKTEEPQTEEVKLNKNSLTKDVKAEELKADEITNPVTKVIVKLYARNGSGNYVIAQTWNAVANGSNTWANAEKNAQQYNPITKGDTVYTYTGEWIDDFGNSYTIGERKQGAAFIALFDGQEGPTAILNIYAQYSERKIPSLTFNYNDNIGHAGGSDNWLDDGTIAYTHTFKEAVDVPNQYTFLYWENFENEDFKNPGETFHVNKGELTTDTTVNYYMVYNYQPSIRVIYHYKNGLKDTGAKLSDIDIYENQPQDLYWFYEDETEPITKGTVASLPALIEKIIDPQDYEEQINVYAHYYTVTWKNENGTVLEIDKDVSYGSIPSYDGEEPTKEADVQYTYTFAGWDKEFTEVTKDITYTAIYNKTLNKYNVKFKNFDDTVLQDEDLDYGTMPEYKQNTPTKEATAQFTYIFTEWTPEIIKVIADAVYIAQYETIVNKYTVTFIDEDGTILSVAQYPYGTVVTDIKLPITPIKAADDDYTYTFDSWTPKMVDVTSDATYQAVYRATAIEKLVPPEEDDDTPTITPPRKPAPIPAIIYGRGDGDPVVEEDMQIAVTETPTAIIESGPAPKAEPVGNWALINLICTILSCIIAIALLFVKKKTDDEEEEYTEEEEKDIRGIKRFKIYSILVGIISIVAFILTEDITLPMILIDKWTILMVILLAINVINIFVMRKKSKQEEDDDDE